MKKALRRRGTIALDADGVLLDYASTYAQAWARAFGESPTLAKPNAYWPRERWGVAWLEGAQLSRFRAAFDEQFWSTIPAVSGALEACRVLESVGYELVCVTAMEERHLQARKRNLRELGFPISKVIATTNEVTHTSPKAEVLRAPEVTALVEDYAPYLRGVTERIHKALILRDPEGSPNVGSELQLADSTHESLLQFARWWVEARSE